MSLKVEVISRSTNQVMVAFSAGPIIPKGTNYEASRWDLVGVLTFPAVVWEHLRDVLNAGQAYTSHPADQVYIEEG